MGTLSLGNLMFQPRLQKCKKEIIGMREKEAKKAKKLRERKHNKFKSLKMLHQSNRTVFV